MDIDDCMQMYETLCVVTQMRQRTTRTLCMGALVTVAYCEAHSECKHSNRRLLSCWGRAIGDNYSDPAYSSSHVKLCTTTIGSLLVVLVVVSFCEGKKRQ